VRVPLSWLREYVDVDVPVHELARRLSISTLEVERVLETGVPDTNGNLGLFQVGRVVEAGKHPNADRLQLCRVDVGESEPRQIVCGAWNFGAGATVAVALPGALLPGADAPLGEAKLRGETSRGMILSERELQLGDDHSGIMVLQEGVEPGTPLADVLPIADAVLEVVSTMNRGDLLSVYGVAREVAALDGTELRPMPGRDPVAGGEGVSIEIDDLEGCPRYIGRVFRGVAVGPSPVWLRARLAGVGIRSISNIVDVTNYVMHALGSPLHVFDRSTLAEGRIVVRRAAQGEEIRTLDGDVRSLDPRDLVIADAEKPVAIAGVMGGLDTEVTESTTEVLLEAANFEPITILETSERLGLRSEASNRWEKGVDPHLAEPAAAYASELILALAAGELVGSADVHAPLPEPPVVRLRPERTNAVLGLEVTEAEQRQILVRLRFGVDDEWDVTVPTWRARDVTREIDLVEEVGRVVLDRIPLTLPRRRHVRGRLTKEQRLRRLVEDVLVGLGFDEAYSWSLATTDPDEHALRLPDPMTADQAVLRTTLLPGLVDAARVQLDAAAESVALFEVARVYLPSGEQLPDERWRVGAIVQGGFLRAKGAVESIAAAAHVTFPFERDPAPGLLLHPGKTARTPAGVVGELHPALLEGEWGVFELDLATLADAAPERVEYEDVITFPALLQDLAFAVPEDVEAGALVAAVREAGSPELRDVRVFDVYRGEQLGAERKSVALRLAFQSPERTLSDDDAAMLRERIVAALADRFGAELRG
jgi:phenylalanyl-tRNA synthetase beta chain